MTVDTLEPAMNFSIIAKPEWLQNKEKNIQFILSIAKPKMASK